MSLKAKIEAVIYASEEPVTLVQLTGLLGQEAEAELNQQASRQATLAIPLDGPLDGADDSPMPAHDGAEELEAAEAPANGSAEGAAETAEAKRAARDRERRVREYLRGMVEELIRDYVTSDRGMEVREVAGGYRLATKPEYHDAVRGFVKSLKPPLKLTLQALETLAVVAYKQPVTAPEVSEIRGVDSGGVLGSLMARKLITTAGRKQVIGRPILYKTTKDFLLRFGLKDVSELPSISEFEKMAGELARQEEIEMPQTEYSRESDERITHEKLEEEAHAASPQADGDSEDLDAGDSDVVATPEGDNEVAPDQPLGGATDAAVSGLEVPRGSEPDEYKNDKA